MPRPAPGFGRRAALTLGAGLLGCPALAETAKARTLRFAPHANLVNLDPVWSNQYMSRNHGFMVYDTLYGTDAAFQPQMAAGHLFEEDGLLCTITLREGLRFHDGEPVLARDCVASLRGWMRRSSVGQTLETWLAALEAVDDRRLHLRRPFAQLFSALGSVASSVPYRFRTAATIGWAR